MLTMLLSLRLMSDDGSEVIANQNEITDSMDVYIRYGCGHSNQHKIWRGWHGNTYNMKARSFEMCGLVKV